jgi:hypothetical protein
MKIDVSQQLKDFDGKPITDESYQPLTIRVLLRMYAGSYVPQKGEDAVIAHAVALKIHSANGEVDVTNEEYKILCECIKQPRHGAAIYAPMYAAVMEAKET